MPENKVEYKVDEKWVEEEILQKFFDLEDKLVKKSESLESDKHRASVAHTDECLKSEPNEDMKRTEVVKFERCKAKMEVIEQIRQDLSFTTRAAKTGLYRHCRP